MSTTIECPIAQAVADLSAGRLRPESIERLYEHVMSRLVRWANRLLGRVPWRAADEEDIANNAFHRFCVLASAGQFDLLEDVNQLWAILYTITRNEASGLRQYVYAQMGSRERAWSAGCALIAF